MTKYLAGVLSVIAMGILLIAYSLLKLGASSFDPRLNRDMFAGPTSVGERMLLPQDLQDLYGSRYAYGARSQEAPYGYAPYGVQSAGYVPTSARSEAVAPAPRRVVTTQYVERRPRRDWKKTALVIGGSTAGAAGLGAIFGGKKGALIGAALGGGASTIYEATKR